jgi:DNA-binding XRE family transcriptional regulator
MQIRHKLKEQRLKLGYTQEKVAELTGIERTRYTRIETGKAARVALFEAFAISKVLLSDVHELFPYEIEVLSIKPTGTQD